VSGLDRRRFLHWIWLGPTTLALGMNTACRRSEPEPSSSAVPEGEGKSKPEITRDPERIVAALRRHFDYLEFEEDALAGYARDYLRYLAPPDLADTDLYTRFLLSNDFFQNGADESRAMHYVAFYDPYVTACRNPFARLDD